MLRTRNRFWRNEAPATYASATGTRTNEDRLSTDENFGIDPAVIDVRVLAAWMDGEARAPGAIVDVAALADG